MFLCGFDNQGGGTTPKPVFADPTVWLCPSLISQLGKAIDVNKEQFGFTTKGRHIDAVLITTIASRSEVAKQGER